MPWRPTRSRRTRATCSRARRRGGVAGAIHPAGWLVPPAVARDAWDLRGRPGAARVAVLALGLVVLPAGLRLVYPAARAAAAASPGWLEPGRAAGWAAHAFAT